MPKARKANAAEPIESEEESGVIMALAGWIGGKRTMAADICAEFAPPGRKARSFYDVCCGSCAILFRKEKGGQETVNDLHADLINLAIVMQSEAGSAALLSRIDRTILCDELLQSSAAIIGSGRAAPPKLFNVEAGNETTLKYNVTDYHVERAYHYFVVSWMGRGGEGGSSEDRAGLPIRWTSGGGSPARRFRSAAESIPFWWQRLQNVLILNMDMFAVLEKIADEVGTVIYIDPPYFDRDPSGKKLRSVKYRHEFAPADHLRLALAASRFTRARVVISYYFHPSLFDLFRGFTIRDMSRAKHLSNAHGRGDKTSIAEECLLLNGASYAKDAKIITRESTDGGQMSIIDELPKCGN